jgi:hypothetical protein
MSSHGIAAGLAYAVALIGGGAAGAVVPPHTEAGGSAR